MRNQTESLCRVQIGSELCPPAPPLRCRCPYTEKICTKIGPGLQSSCGRRMPQARLLGELSPPKMTASRLRVRVQNPRGHGPPRASVCREPSGRPPAPRGDRTVTGLSHYRAGQKSTAPDASECGYSGQHKKTVLSCKSRGLCRLGTEEESVQSPE